MMMRGGPFGAKGIAALAVASRFRFFLLTIHLVFHPALYQSAVRAAAKAVKSAIVVPVTNPAPDPTVGVERRRSGAKAQRALNRIRPD
jgi:hypothetical protein